MGIFSFFKKQQPILFRCTNCYYEFEYSADEARLLEMQNAGDPACTVKEECHICHIGFMIPWRYTTIDGKEYRFHEIKPKIKNLNPDTVMQRIFENPDSEYIMFINPEDCKKMIKS